MRNMNTANPLLLIAFVVMAASACSTNDDTGSADVPCTEEGCLCVFAADCPTGMNCVNGQCSTSNPIADLFSNQSDTAEDSPDVTSGEGSTALDSASAEILTDQQFGESCIENLQCASGWCLDSPDGGYCSQTCDLGCPQGWTCKTIAQTYPDYISICVQDKTRLCLPCEIDSHCGDAGDYCLDIGGGKFCGRNCAEEPCPTGYHCEAVQTADGPHQQCLPQNEACDCNPNSVGQVRGCQLTNEIGTCFGEETCDAVKGWTDCTALEPADELCDGIDNDCNGQFDEGFAKEPCEIVNEFGVCHGDKTCQGPAGWVCATTLPKAEQCNGVDDNCDGDVDGEFLDENGLYVHVENCQTCGNSCVAKFPGAAEVACEVVDGVPTCLILACEPGFFRFNELTCLGEDSFLCLPCTADEDCFGDFSQCLQISVTDPRAFCFRDCSGESNFSITCPDGYTCMPHGDATLCLPDNNSCDCTFANEGQEKACSLQNEAGLCFGNETCIPELGWSGCTAVVPAAELCDGIDNDCDGLADEEMSTGFPCQALNEFGTCFGEEYCAGEAGVLCSAATPATEICDGIDNNCDGQTDEGYALTVGTPPVLKYGLSVQNCGACGYQCPDVPHGTEACNAEPEVPACVVEECEDGYYNYNDVACLPVPSANLCNPCMLDSDCQGPADLCVPEDSGAYCGRDCSAGAIYTTPEIPCTGQAGTQDCCPEGYVCQASFEDRQCRPHSATCTCVEEGKTVACTNQNEFGTCVGVKTCTTTGPDAGWSGCDAPSPTAEICDGLDNDCDGIIDAQDPNLDFGTTPSGTEQCINGTACFGDWLCMGADWFCSAQPASQEACDGTDNDCDGGVDEDFVVGDHYLHPSHCGACGHDCQQLIPNSIAPQCELVGGLPTCFATVCEPGYFPYGDGQVCLLLPDNLCQPCGIDADCLVPSSTCVDLGVEQVCGHDCSAQSPYGPGCPQGYECNGNKQCTPISGTCICGPDTEGMTRSCTDGACIGLQTCESIAGLFKFTDCSAEGVIPEVCDGIDNDCDGSADEGFVNNAGKYVHDENCGVCANNCLTQFDEPIHHAVGECNSAAAPPVCRIKNCTTEELEGQTYEWIDINGLKDDGCECGRKQGNTSFDPPDTLFYADGQGQPSYPSPNVPYQDANCDGIDGVVEDALFVSAANPNPGNGTMESPYQTVGQALAAFAGAGKEYVLVAGGVYEENVTMFSGLRLHGGYSPDFSSRDIVLFSTELRGMEPNFDANPAHGTIRAVSITGPMTTLVSGFTIVGYDVAEIPQSGAGHSSYAVYVLDTDNHFELRNSRVVGGFGGNGPVGQPGGTGFGALSNGGGALMGANGSNAGPCYFGICMGKTQPGGAGGTNPQCGGTNGPQGGGVVCPVYNQPSYTPADPAHDGAPGWSWTTDAGSSWGCNSHATEAGYPNDIKKMDGGDGHPGADGGDGQQGDGCGLSAGQFANGVWMGNAGGSGAGGNGGQAGGAGGSSGGLDTASGANMPPGVGPSNSPHHKLGAAGGGAGAGGCGGSGGTGGGAGGASIAIFVAYSNPQQASNPPVIAANMVQRGYGGLGGIGGYGGAGGDGGDGGDGGHSAGFWIDFKAGDGGRGGRGGIGGGGGGGCGGAGLGIATLNYPETWNLNYTDANSFTLEDNEQTGGAGGLPGPSGAANPAGEGASGLSKNSYSVPAP